MPLWVIILLISLCLTTVTGIYTLRQNGRNGHRNGNGNGHTISQMAKTTEQSLSGEPPSKGKKMIALSVSKILLGEEESPQETVTKWNQSKNNAELPDEDPHDHPDSHEDVPPALRERRRPLRLPREDEEEDEDDELPHPERSAAPETLPAPNKVMIIEIGIQEEWQHDEDVTDTLIVKKDAETQTTVFQEDKSVEAHPDRMDEEVQNSPIKESLTTQTLLSTEEKGIGEPLETQNREAQVSPDQGDKSLQESPEHHSIGVGTNEKEMRDQSLQIQPEREDQSQSINISMNSQGIQKDESEDFSLIPQSLSPINTSFKLDLPSFFEDISFEESIILPSPKSIKSQSEEENSMDEPFSIKIPQVKSFHLSDLPLDESQGDSPKSLRRSNSWVIFNSEDDWSIIHSRSSFQTVKSEKIEENLRQ